MVDKDKYVVYHGIEHEMASFGLYDRNHDKDYDRPRAMGAVTMDPDEVPDGIERMDHFWVEFDDEGEITALEPAPEMYEQRKDEYQAAVEIFKERQERQKQKWGEADGE